MTKPWKPEIVGTGPKYAAIADAIAEGISSGKLNPGDPMPTHRDLAEKLGVTVGTITRAYVEAARRGLVRGERGRGTYVMNQRQGFAGLGNSGAVLDLGLAATVHSMAPALGSALAELASRPGLDQLLTRHQSRGLPHHREAGTLWLKRYGFETTPDNVLVCAGSQQALMALLCAILQPGDRLAVEEFTYPLIKNMCKRLSLHVVPIAMDEFGLIPEELERACKRERISALYTMPSCQNPTLTRMPEYRRHEVAETARRHNFSIIEDDTYSLTVGAPLPPLSALAPERGYCIAGTSKVLCDGLRIAFLGAPPDSISALETAIEMSAWKAAGLMAELVALWIENGTADRTIKANREEAAIRNAMAEDIFGPGSFKGRPTGSYIWMPLPKNLRSAEFCAKAAKQGIAIANEEHFAITQPPYQAVRIALSGVRRRDDLEQGLKTLAGLM